MGTEPETSLSTDDQKKAPASFDVHELAFDRLPKAVQTRLLDSLVKNLPPQPLLSSITRKPFSAGPWRIIAVCAFLASAAFWIEGFALPLRTSLLSPQAAAIAQFTSITIFVFAALIARRATVKTGGATYPSGRFLFAMSLVDVNENEIRVRSLDDLEGIEVEGTAVVLTFTDGSKESFPNQDNPWVRVATAKQDIVKAHDLEWPADMAQIALFDPFVELRYDDSWSSAAASDRSSSLITRVPSVALPILALVGGATAGAAAFFGAHHQIKVVDEARFNAACVNHDEAALERYVAMGGPRTQRAERALFETRKSSIEALVTYVRGGGALGALADDELFETARNLGESKGYRFYLEHGNRHVDEVKKTLLPGVLFAEATKLGSGALLLDFLREFPEHSNVGEAQLQTKKLYAEALQNYIEMQKPDEERKAFMTALLDSLQQRRNARVVLHAAVATETVASRKLQGKLIDWFKSVFPKDTVRFDLDETADTNMPRIRIVAVDGRGETIQFEAADRREKGPADIVTVRQTQYTLRFSATIPGRKEKLAWERPLGTSWLGDSLTVRRGSSAQSVVEADILRVVPDDVVSEIRLRF